METCKITSIDFRLDWLFKEIEMLEKKIEFFDNLFFKIKGWAVVSWFALKCLFYWCLFAGSIIVAIILQI